MTTPEQPAKRGFVLADVVEPLHYDLTPYGPVGTVPEPSQKLIDAWNLENAKINQENRLDIAPDAKPADIAAAIVAAAEKSPEVNQRAIESYARLCGAVPKQITRNKTKVTVWEGGSPTYDELQALPYRAAAAFYGWLTGELRPENLPAATTS